MPRPPAYLSLGIDPGARVAACGRAAADTSDAQSQHTGDMPGGGRGRHSRGSGGEDRLGALGRQLPRAEPPQIVQALALERARRVMRHSIWLVLVVAIVVYVAVQLLRPYPGPVFLPAAKGSVRLPGSVPSLPLPTSGSAAIALLGGGTLKG